MKAGFFYHLIAAGMLVLLYGVQANAGPVQWRQLNPDEQAVLKPFQQKWDGFPESNQKILRNWANKSPAERAHIRQRRAEWLRLSPSGQKKLITQLQRYKQMPESKRQRLKAWHNWVKRLPAHEQHELREKWPGMTNEQRKNYIQRLRKQYGWP